MKIDQLRTSPRWRSGRQFFPDQKAHVLEINGETGIRIYQIAAEITVEPIHVCVHDWHNRDVVQHCLTWSHSKLRQRKVVSLHLLQSAGSAHHKGLFLQILELGREVLMVAVGKYAAIGTRVEGKQDFTILYPAQEQRRQLIHIEPRAVLARRGARATQEVSIAGKGYSPQRLHHGITKDGVNLVTRGLARGHVQAVVIEYQQHHIPKGGASDHQLREYRRP